MNDDAMQGDLEFDELLTGALKEHAMVTYRSGDGGREDVWPRIDRRRRRQGRSQLVWTLSAAAAVLVFAVLGATVSRRGPEVDMSPAGTAHVTAPPTTGGQPPATDPVGAPTSADPNPTTTVAGAASAPSSTTTVTAQSPASVRSISLGSLEVPTSICASTDYTVMQPARARLGSEITAEPASGATASQPRRPMAMRYGEAQYGEVTGDGVEDAVVVVLCGFGGRLSSQFFARAVVVDGARGTATAGPLLNGSGAPIEADAVPSADGSGTRETVQREKLWESMVALRIENGTLVSTWVQTANPVIPRVNQWSRRVESRHRVSGSDVVVTGAPTIGSWTRDPYGSTEPFGPTSW